MTSLAIVLSPEASKRARRLHWLGFALICVAFVLPFLAIPRGLTTEAKAGYDSVSNLMVLFVLALVAWLATRKRGDMPKAIARLLTGVLVVLFVGGGLAVAASDAEQSKVLLKDSLAFAAKQSARSVDLGQRFEKVDMNGVLTVESLTSPAGLAVSKAAAPQYRALLAERRSLVSSYLTEYERYFTGLPNGDFKAGAMASMGANKAATVKLYSDLDVAQTAWVDSISNVLDWAGNQAGQLSARGTQLMFRDQAQKAEMTALVDKVTASEANLNKVLQAATATQAAAQGKTRANMAEADKILAE